MMDRHEVWDIAPHLSGLPRIQREGRLILALQLYADESGKDGGHAFFMGGFLAQAQDWASFSDEWSQILQREPAVPYLHTGEAYSCKGMYNVWSKKEMEGRFKDISEIILKYNFPGFVVAVSERDFKEGFFYRIDRRYDTPYYFIIHELVGAVLYGAANSGEKDKIDMIFDEQMHESDLVLDDWGDFKRVLNGHPYGAMYPDRPIFRTDRSSPPLQAADFLLWHIRRASDQGSTIAIVEDNLSKVDFKIKVVSSDYIQAMAGRIISNMNAEGLLTYHQADKFFKLNDRYLTSWNNIQAKIEDEIIPLYSLSSKETIRFRLVDRCSRSDIPHLHRKSGNACLGGD